MVRKTIAGGTREVIGEQEMRTEGGRIMRDRREVAASNRKRKQENENVKTQTGEMKRENLYFLISICCIPIFTKIRQTDRLLNLQSIVSIVAE